jgi:hypothetical protein
VTCRKPLKRVKAKMMRRQHSLCFYCKTFVVADGKNGRHSAINEHRIPLSRGGRHYGNIVVACWRCDNLKGDLTDTEFLRGVACAGGFDEYEAFHKRALYLARLERNKRRALRQHKFVNPEQFQQEQSIGKPAQEDHRLS